MKITPGQENVLSLSNRPATGLIYGGGLIRGSSIERQHKWPRDKSYIFRLTLHPVRGETTVVFNEIRWPHCKELNVMPEREDPLTLTNGRLEVSLVRSVRTTWYLVQVPKHFDQRNEVRQHNTRYPGTLVEFCEEQKESTLIALLLTASRKGGLHLGVSCRQLQRTASTPVFPLRAPRPLVVRQKQGPYGTIRAARPEGSTEKYRVWKQDRWSGVYVAALKGGG